MDKTGKKLERRVAQAYRQIGARRVEHNAQLAGHQIDVYIELETPDRSLHRIAVEAKDHSSPIGIQIVSDFSDIVDRLRRERLIDEGVIVSSEGFSRPARSAAHRHGIRLLEPEDLEAIVAERLQFILLTSRQVRFLDEHSRELEIPAASYDQLLHQFHRLQKELEVLLPAKDLASALAVASKYTGVADAIAVQSAKRMQKDLDQSSCLSIDLICSLQQSLFPEGYALTGIRRSQVWIGPPGVTLDKAEFVPPPANEVRPLLEDLFFTWNSRFDELLRSSKEMKVQTLADFHTRFWMINPFLDGNADVSRLILNMQVRDLFNKKIDLTYSATAYSSMLRSAALGNQQRLLELVQRIVE